MTGDRTDLGSVTVADRGAAFIEPKYKPVEWVLLKQASPYNGEPEGGLHLYERVERLFSNQLPVLCPELRPTDVRVGIRDVRVYQKILENRQLLWKKMPSFGKSRKKPWKCPVCGKPLPSNRDRENHMVNAHGMSPKDAGSFRRRTREIRNENSKVDSFVMTRSEVAEKHVAPDIKGARAGGEHHRKMQEGFLRDLLDSITFEFADRGLLREVKEGRGPADVTVLVPKVSLEEAEWKPYGRDERIAWIPPEAITWDLEHPYIVDFIHDPKEEGHLIKAAVKRAEDQGITSHLVSESGYDSLARKAEKAASQPVKFGGSKPPTELKDYLQWEPGRVVIHAPRPEPETPKTSEEVIEKMKNYVKKGYTEGRVKVRDSGDYLSLRNDKGDDKYIGRIEWDLFEKLDGMKIRQLYTLWVPEVEMYPGDHDKILAYIHFRKEKTQGAKYHELTTPD